VVPAEGDGIRSAVGTRSVPNEFRKLAEKLLTQSQRFCTPGEGEAERPNYAYPVRRDHCRKVLKATSQRSISFYQMQL
jgi:hypothetical protein